MKYFYQIVNIPWFNSTVDVWAEGDAENKTRLRVLGFQKPGISNCSDCLLKSKMVEAGVINKDDEITCEKFTE